MTEQAPASPPLQYGVVVGDDGSSRALDAVRFAVDEARRRGTTLDVVRAWTIPTAVRPTDVGPGEVPSTGEFEAATRAVTEKRVGALTQPGDPEVRVYIVHGSPSKALVAMSQQAQIVVVGDRGVGGLAGRFLGSTADAVIRQSRCPVTLVRQPIA